MFPWVDFTLIILSFSFFLSFSHRELESDEEGPSIEYEGAPLEGGYNNLALITLSLSMWPLGVLNFQTCSIGCKLLN